MNIALSPAGSAPQAFAQAVIDLAKTLNRVAGLSRAGSGVDQEALRAPVQPSKPMSRSSETAPGPKVMIASAITAQGR